MCPLQTEFEIIMHEVYTTQTYGPADKLERSLFSTKRTNSSRTHNRFGDRSFTVVVITNQMSSCALSCSRVHS